MEEKLTILQINLLDNINPVYGYEYWLLSKEERHACNQLVKLGYMVKGTADTKQKQRVYNLTGKKWN